MAECENVGSDLVCHCPLGFGGRLCTEKVPLLNPHAARMNGLSFLSFDNSYLTQSNLGFELIEFSLKTTQEEGLLFFYGQSNENGDNGKDFLAVSLNGTKVEMTFELGSGVGRVQSNVIITDNTPHRVLIKLRGRQGTIEVDGNSSSAEAPGRLSVLNANGDIFFGGVPSSALMNGSKHSTGFSGCIWDLKIGISGILDLINSSKRSRNIAPCEDEP